MRACVRARGPVPACGSRFAPFLCAGPSDGMTTSRRRFASAAAAGLLTALTPRSSRAVDAELYKNLNVDDPYLLMEPAGESFRGNKGPNLQLPEELNEDDEEPEALSTRIRQKPSVDFLENLRYALVSGALLPYDRPRLTLAHTSAPRNSLHLSSGAPSSTLASLTSTPRPTFPAKPAARLAPSGMCIYVCVCVCVCDVRGGLNILHICIYMYAYIYTYGSKSNSAPWFASPERRWTRTIYANMYTHIYTYLYIFIHRYA